MGKRKVALYHAFHTSLPIMAGYGFLGLTYGIYMHELGFNFLYPLLHAAHQNLITHISPSTQR